MSWVLRLYDRLRAFWTKRVFNRAVREFIECIESDTLDAFLEMLLRLMSMMLLIDRDYHRNIDNFNVRYLFRSQDGGIQTSAIFHDGRMKVSAGAIADPDITVTFTSNRALMQFLFSERPDLIGSIIDNEVSYVGNLNYLSKLAYMAKNLQRRLQPR